MARTRVVAVVLLLPALGCLSTACSSFRSVAPEPRSRASLERRARERPTRVETAGGAWSAQELEVLADSLRFSAPGTAGEESRIVVPIREVRDLSVQDPRRGAGIGTLLGMLIGSQIGLWIDIARDSEGDTYDGAGGGTAVGTVVGGVVGLAAGSRWGGWTHYRFLPPRDPPETTPPGDSR